MVEDFFEPEEEDELEARCVKGLLLQEYAKVDSPINRSMTN